MIGVKLNIYVDSYIKQRDIVKQIVDDRNGENSDRHEAVRDEYVLIPYDGRPDYDKTGFGLLISDDSLLLAEFSSIEGCSTLYIGDCNSLSDKEQHKIANILSEDMPELVLYKGISHIMDGIVTRYREWLYKYVFQTLIDSSPDMVWVKDEAGRHVILNDMFGKIDSRIKPYINDYRLNLITPGEVKDFTKFASGLGIVLEFIQNSDDKKQMRSIIESRKEYKSVDINTVDIINAYTNARISKKDAKGDRIDMCTAIQGLIEDGRHEGRVEGITEGENMLIKLLKLLKPGSKEYDKALNGTSAERKKLYKKYKIID